MRSGIRLIGLIGAMVAVLLLSQIASAHTPFFVDRDITRPETAWPVGDYSISWAFYARLSPAYAPQYYVLDGQASTRLVASLETPAIAGLDNFRPSIAVIGPGLPAFETPQNWNAPTGYGGMLVNDEDVSPRPQFFESFSGTSYYRGPQLDLVLPADGRYYVVVFDRSGGSGKYTLAIGTREVFGGGDPAWRQKLTEFFKEPGIDPASQAPSNHCAKR